MAPIYKLKTTRSSTQHLIHDKNYTASEELSIGVLPTKQNVLECMMHLMRPVADRLQVSLKEASNILARNLTRHWEFANIYTIGWRHVSSKIFKLYEKARTNWQETSRKRKTSDSWVKKMKVYNDEMTQLFDIFCTNKEARSKQEKATGIKMGDQEYAFLEDMRTNRKMFCENFVDRQWQKYYDRKLKEEKYLEEQQKKIQLEKMEKETSELSYRNEVLQEETATNIFTGDDYQPEAEKNQGVKRKRIQIIEAIEPESSNMPNQYRHLREGSKVRPQFYTTVDCLQSKFHMSEKRSVGAVIEVGNGLFGRVWKYQDENPEVIDIDTAPDSRSVRRASTQITMMTYDLIVKELMRDHSAVVCYMTDGSKSKGVGSFTVQGFMINNKWRPLPQLKVSSETRENQAALQKAILNILAEASSVSAKDIFERITFKITDSVSHNLHVDDLVAMDLGSDHVPPHLLCHVHVVLMFSRKMMEVIEVIEKRMGPEKIYPALLVNATTHHGSVHEQFVDCVMKFLSADFNHKPWNKSAHFSKHIHPKINRAKGFRTERFNRYVFCCLAVIHHSHDLEEYLLKYDSIVNTLACIIRAFETCLFFKIFSAAVALMGVHLIQPYLQITL